MTGQAEVSIRIESPYADGVAALIEAADAFAASLYPPESNHGAPAEKLASPDARFFVARMASEAVGCVCVVPEDAAWSEIKRLFVHDRARGLGLGDRLMSLAEAAALESRTRFLRLETGVKNFSALRLYRARGYRVIARFGSYPDDPLSVFMEKALG